MKKVELNIGTKQKKKRQRVFPKTKYVPFYLNNVINTHGS